MHTTHFLSAIIYFCFYDENPQDCIEKWIIGTTIEHIEMIHRYIRPEYIPEKEDAEIWIEPEFNLCWLLASAQTDTAFENACAG